MLLEAPRKNQQAASGVEEIVKMNRPFLIVGRDFWQHHRQHWLADHGRLQHGTGVKTHDSGGVIQRIEVVVLRRRIDRMAAEQCDVLELGKIDFLPLLEPPRMRPDEDARSSQGRVRTSAHMLNPLLDEPCLIGGVLEQ